MGDWIPLFQTLAWILLIAFMIFFARKLLGRLARAIVDRVERGGEVELSAGPLKAKMGELRSLPRVDPTALPTYPETAAEPQGWTKVRDELGKTARGVHLVHVVEPSTVEPGWFEIYAYLVGHKRGQYGYPADLSDVEKAEFYLGRFWGNEIFPVSGTGGREPIGLATRAFGPTTAVCRVHFTDGATAILSRYLDLELEVGF